MFRCFSGLFPVVFFIPSGFLNFPITTRKLNVHSDMDETAQGAHPPVLAGFISIFGQKYPKIKFYIYYLAKNNPKYDFI